MPDPRPAYQPPPSGADQGSLVRLGLAEPDPIPEPSISPFLEPDLPPWEDDE